MVIGETIDILLVEDSLTDTLLAQEALNEWKGNAQFRLIHATRLDQCMDRLRTAPVDVILLDLGLPDSQGLDTLRRLRAGKSDIPVIIMTGSDDENQSLRAVQEGAQDYVVKSQMRGDLLWKSIRYAIERNRAQVASYELRAIVEGTDDAIIGEDLDGRVIGWNPGAERLYGYLAEEVLGKHFSLLVPPTDRDEATGVRERAKRGERVAPFESVRQHKNGKLIDVQVCLSPVRDSQGRIVAISRIDHDIAEKKRLEEQFRHAQKMDAIGRLAGGVAHDFNNMLTIICGYSEIVFETLPSGHALRDLVGEIRKAGKKAESLTRQLLAFSRKSALEPQLLNLNEVVANSKKMFERIMREDIVIKTRLARDPVNVNVDPGQIEHAIMNLVLNARDAMPDGGTITIATDNIEVNVTSPEMAEGIEPGPYVMLEVADTGCGMDEEIRSRVFEPFFTTKEPGKGTGLGLSMIYGFVKQSGGHVIVKSEKGQGAIFRILLPQATEKDDSPGMPLDVVQPISQGSETILLVEDEQSVRTVTRLFLTSAGYKVLEASCGAEAIQTAEQYDGTIDLLVSDVVLPQMEGRAVSEGVRAVKPGTKTLLLSEYADDAVRRNGILGAEIPVLQRPFASAVLRQKVREVLDQSV